MYPTKRMFRALLIASAFVSAVAAAQGTSVITGTVTDAATGKPVPDVVVTATSPALQGEEISVTDATGVYRFASLPAGVFTLRLEKESYKPFSRPDITIRVDRTVRVNIQLQPESVTGDTVVVVGRPPTVDVGSTATGVNVGHEFIDNISFLRPTGNGLKSFESLAAIAPQTVADDDYGGFNMNGATSSENGIYIDGLNSNDPQTGSNGAQMPVEFVQEANIVTGGYQAEYGRAGGGIISAVTKSGSNEFHGDVWVNYTPGLLTGKQKEVTSAAVSQATKSQPWNTVDFGADIGGPIIKDKLWFYVGVAPSFVRRRDVVKFYALDETTGEFNSTAVQHTGANGQASDYEIHRFDDRRAITYIAKLTYAINDDHRISLSVNGANSQRSVPFALNGQNSGFVVPDSNNNLTLKYTGGFLDRKLLVDATFGWFHQTAAPYGLPNDGTKLTDNQSGKGAAGTPEFILYNAVAPYNLPEFRAVPADVAAACTASDGSALCPVTGNGASYAIGGFGYMQQNTNDRLAASAKVSYFLNALGHHTFKGGIDFEHSIYSTTKAYSGLITAQENTGGSRFTDVRRFAYLSGPTVNDIVDIPVLKVTPTLNQVGAFLQDSWAIMDVVTLNAGIRYDNQVLFNGKGEASMALNNMWSPRVGVIYDPTQQGKSKIYANFSRYYQTIPLNIADRALSGENQVSLSRLVGGGCDPASGANSSNYQQACQNFRAYGDIYNGGLSVNHYAQPTGQGASPIDPNLQAQAKDEIVVGGEYEIIPDLRVGVSYTKSWVLNIIEDMSNDEGSTYFIGNPGQGMAADFPKAKRDYDAVTVLATKAFSDGWVGQASYTWSYLRGNWTGFIDTDYGQATDPGSTAAFDLKSLLANNSGPLPGDRTHIIKFYGAKNFQVTNSFGLLLGLTYEGYSGQPLSYLGAHPLYGPGLAFILPRGAAGRAPWVHTFNLKAGASYKFSKDMTVGFTVDILNMFNFQAATSLDQNYTTESVLPYTPAKGENAQESICAAGATAGPSCVSKVTMLDGDGAPTLKLADENINKNFKQPLSYQAPLQVRFGLKFSF